MAGYLFVTDEAAGIRTTSHQAPNALFRIGVLDWAELRLVVNGAAVQNVTGASQISGAVDTQVGAKFHFFSENGWLPETALVSMVTMPTGDRGFSSDRSDPSALLALAYTLTDKLSVGSNFGLAWETTLTSAGNRTTLGQFNWTLSFAYELSEKYNLGMYAEVFGNEPFTAQGSASKSFDTGVTWIAAPNIQFDAEVGVGLNDAADDLFVGTGITIRFPQ